MTIREVSERYGLSADTLRYYERVGLIPPVPRTAGGVRDYDAPSLGWVELIKCMRSAGVGIEALTEYCRLFQQGEETQEARKALLVEQRRQLLERMEDIRFHRNPLEVVLQFLPQGTRTTEVDPEDYHIYFHYYDEQGQLLGGFSFNLTYWYRWNFQQRALPLYVLHGQEKGRELGTFLWEMTRVKYGLT